MILVVTYPDMYLRQIQNILGRCIFQGGLYIHKLSLQHMGRGHKHLRYWTFKVMILNEDYPNDKSFDELHIAEKNCLMMCKPEKVM